MRGASGNSPEALAKHYGRYYEACSAQSMGALQNHGVMADERGDNGCLLMIDLDENTGGAVAYRESQIRYLQAEGWRIILLRYGRDDGNWFLSIRYLPEERPVRLDSLQDIEHLLDVISVKRVFVNNLAFYANIDEALEFLRRMKRKHPFQLHYVFHDFLSLCPSFFLLDKNNRYCQSVPRSAVFHARTAI